MQVQIRTPDIQQPAPLAPAVPFVSVIVPVRNEAACIASTLSQLLTQRYPADRFEVLVADGGSSDETRTIVHYWMTEYPQLHLLDNPNRWSSAGRNVAVRAARGDLLLLIDGHCQIANDHYLTELVDAFARSGADCIGRPQPLNVTGATPVQRAIAAARSSRLGHHPASHIYSDEEAFVPPQSVAIAYRREVFERIGYFDETFDACEDFEFNHRAARAGLHCFFSPRVQVHYHPRGTLAGLFRQLVRYGRGRVRLLRKHQDTASIPGFVPAAFLAGLVIGPLLALLVPPLAWAYGGVLLLYVLAVLAGSLHCAWQQRDLHLLPLLPLVFVTIHLAAGTGVWLEVFTGRRLVRRRLEEIAPGDASVANAGERRGVSPPVLASTGGLTPPRSPGH